MQGTFGPILMKAEFQMLFIISCHLVSYLAVSALSKKDSWPLCGHVVQWSCDSRQWRTGSLGWWLLALGQPHWLVFQWWACGRCCCLHIWQQEMNNLYHDTKYNICFCTESFRVSPEAMESCSTSHSKYGNSMFTSLHSKIIDFRTATDCYCCMFLFFYSS